MSCQNTEFQGFCARFYKSFPCCREVDKDNALSSLFLDNPEPQSLILQLFELAGLFLEKKMIRFTAQGDCMYPCMRQGDVIYIQPKTIEEIQVGEVAVYRRHNRLFSHRAIAKGQNERGRYIITRPDTALYGDDGPTFNEDILGIVAKMERKSRILAPLKRDYNLMEKIWYGFCLKCSYFKQRFLWKIIYIAAFLQQFRLYRLIAELFSRNLAKRISFVFSTFAGGKVTSRFYRKVSEQELPELIRNNDKNSISKWSIALKINSKQTASLSFILRPANCEFSGWWLERARIMIRHRGTIIEKLLLDKADGLLRRMGVSGIFVSIFENAYNAYLERMFYRGLGFRQVYTYDDSVLKDKIKRRLVRIIMLRETK